MPEKRKIEEKKIPLAEYLLCGLRILIVLAFSRSFRLFLTSYAGLFIMLSFADLLLNTSLRAVSFESA